MSTPTCLEVADGGYTAAAAPTRRQPRQYSGLLKQSMLARTRSRQFRQSGGPVVLVQPRESALVGPGDAPVVAYVGNRLPFEAHWVRTNQTLRVETHQLAGITLVLDLVLAGTVVVDCSRGGTFNAPAGSHLVGWVQRGATHARPVMLPIERHEASHLASLTLPMHSLAAAQVSPHVHMLMYVPWSGDGVRCIECDWTGSMAGLAAHYQLKRFMSGPRAILWVPGEAVLDIVRPAVPWPAVGQPSPAEAVETQVSHMQRVELPLRGLAADRVAHAVPAMHTLAALDIAPGCTVLLLMAWAGGARCTSCDCSGSLADLATHYGVGSFTSAPRRVSWVAVRADSGRAYCGNEYDLRRLATPAVARWKEAFLEQSAAQKSVAWELLPQLDPAELSRRLRACVDAPPVSFTHYM